MIWDEDFSAEQGCFCDDCQADQFSLVWWNVNYSGRLSRQLQELDRRNDPDAKSPLDENLKALIQSKPLLSMIVLAEYSPGLLEPETEQMLRAAFPHHRHFPYNDHSQQHGIGLFCKVAFDVELAPLDWVPLNVSRERQERYRQKWFRIDPKEATLFQRTYIRARVDWQGQKLNVVPVHLLMPWIALQERYGWIGKLVVGLSLMYGFTNPLIHQARRLKKQLVRDFILATEAENVLVVGDFNLPDELFGQAPRAIGMLCENFIEAFPRSVSTFPTNSALAHRDIRRMMIDHAFVNHGLNVDVAEVLPLRGSDHYALGLLVSHKQSAASEEQTPLSG